MAMSYRIDERQRCVFTILSGEIGNWDLGTSAQELLEDPRFNPQFSRLLDATAVTDLKLEPSFVEALAKDFGPRSGSKVALVGASDAVREVLHRYAQSLKGADCRVFGDKGVALQWLGVSED